MFAYVPGSRQARTVLALADGRSESPGESVTRVQFFRYDIPEAQPQNPVVDTHGRLLGTCDWGWDEYRRVGEFDGFAKYERLLRPATIPRRPYSARIVARTTSGPKAPD